MKTLNKTLFLKRLGSWLGKIRKFRGVSQDELSKKAGLSGGVVSRIESGAVDPQVTTIAKIAKALDVPAFKILQMEAGARVAQRV